MNIPPLPVWLRIAALLAVAACVLVTWRWRVWTAINVQDFATSFAAHRHDWYALPAVVTAYVILGLVMVPVVLLIAATGIAFGPLLGPVYAMAGCLISASVGFAIGRSMGLRRVRRFAGDRIARLARTVKRNGTLAVFVIRKVPAPFTLVNIVVGASTVRYRDFIIGTALGMTAIVVGLAGFGYQLAEALHDPTPLTVLGAALFLLVPLTAAVAVNRALRRMSPAG